MSGVQYQTHSRCSAYSPSDYPSVHLCVMYGSAQVPQLSTHPPIMVGREGGKEGERERGQG